ncbi:MAG: hypothetical protein K0S47_4025 [Herbinix sp.]|jgi:glycosyltransferase involved in cell wall biosynthesis|nr:hypothetical protein [Herbinix sp.]
MVKVCHITSAHKRYDTRIFEKECCSLAKHGYEVILLVNDSNGDEIKNKVKITSTGFRPKNRFHRLLFSSGKIYKKAISIDADIYHFHDPDLLFISKKLKKSNKKVVYDSHEFYYMQIREKKYIPKLFRSIVASIYNVIETNVIRKIDAVITPCKFNGENVFENRAKRTVFINNTPRLEEFYNKYEDKILTGDKVCHVGSLTYERGIYHLVKAIKKADVNLLLGGDFKSQEFENTIKNMPEYSSVDYRGYLNKDGIVKIYQECYAGICTILNVGQYNKTDNLATKAYEYMSMGLPVIISDYPYVREVLKKYEFGIAVDPQNTDEIANAIEYLKNNPSDAYRMGQNGRKAIIELFNWNIDEDRLIKLYKSLMKEG